MGTENNEPEKSGRKFCGDSLWRGRLWRASFDARETASTKQEASFVPVRTGMCKSGGTVILLLCSRCLALFPPKEYGSDCPCHSSGGSILRGKLNVWGFAVVVTVDDEQLRAMSQWYSQRNPKPVLLECYRTPRTEYERIEYPIPF
jgi:hypothetical protein